MQQMRTIACSAMRMDFYNVACADVMKDGLAHFVPVPQMALMPPQMRPLKICVANVSAIHQNWVRFAQIKVNVNVVYAIACLVLRASTVSVPCVMMIVIPREPFVIVVSVFANMAGRVINAIARNPWRVALDQLVKFVLKEEAAIVELVSVRSLIRVISVKLALKLKISFAASLSLVLNV